MLQPLACLDRDSCGASLAIKAAIGKLVQHVKIQLISFNCNEFQSSSVHFGQFQSVLSVRNAGMHRQPAGGWKQHLKSCLLRDVSVAILIFGFEQVL